MFDAIGAAVDVTAARMRAEFWDEDLLMCYAAFNLKSWWLATESASKRQELRKQVKALISGFGLDLTTGLREFELVAPILARDEKDMIEKGTPADNRIVWNRVLQSDFQAKLPAFQGALEVLPLLVRIYIGTLDQEVDVERDLKALMEILHKHSGNEVCPEILDALLHVLKDGPRCEADVGWRPPGGSTCQGDSDLRLTDFTRECAQLWVECHGRRFALYQTRRKNPKKPAKKGTMKFVKKMQRRALDALTKTGAGQTEASDTIFKGTKRTHLVSDLRVSGIRNERLDRFQEQTDKKVETKKLIQKLRAEKPGNPNPFRTQTAKRTWLKPRRGNIFVKQKKVFAARALCKQNQITGCPPPDGSYSHGKSTIEVVTHIRGFVAAQTSVTGNYSVAVIGDHDGRPVGDSLSLLKEADVLVWDQEWSLSGFSLYHPDEDISIGKFVRIALIVVAKGMAVVSQQNWCGSRPELDSSKALRHLPAAKVVPAKLALTGTLLERKVNTGLCDRIRWCCEGIEGSQWTLGHNPDDPTVTVLDSPRALLSFLMNVERHEQRWGIVYRNRQAARR